MRVLLFAAILIGGIFWRLAGAETDNSAGTRNPEHRSVVSRSVPGGTKEADPDPRRGIRVEWPRALSEALFPDKPLTLGIKKTSSPRRAFALRMAERGRELLINREYTKALSHLEMALGLESVPYFYYYLAQAHYLLEQFDLSSKFLEVAETLLSSEPGWRVEVRELRRKLVLQAEFASRMR